MVIFHGYVSHHQIVYTIFIFLWLLFLFDQPKGFYPTNLNDCSFLANPNHCLLRPSPTSFAHWSWWSAHQWWCLCCINPPLLASTLQAFFWGLGAWDPSAGLSGSGLYGLRRTAHEGPASGRCRTWGQWLPFIGTKGMVSLPGFGVCWLSNTDCILRNYRSYSRFCQFDDWVSKMFQDINGSVQYKQCQLMAIIVITVRKLGTRIEWCTRRTTKNIWICTSRAVAYKLVFFGWCGMQPSTRRGGRTYGYSSRVAVEKGFFLT